MLKLEINDRAALAIKNGKKRVEIRANKDNEDYSKVRKDNIIKFTSSKIGDFYVRVKEVNHYDTLEELLMMEGTRYTVSSTNDYYEAIKNVYKLNGYREAISKDGVYAIHIEYLYSEKMVWKELLQMAKNVINEHKISNTISSGSVAAVILTKNHHIYKGVCIDTACSLGMCAERNAISTMITNKDYSISKIVCIGSDMKILPLCGACREFLMQISNGKGDIELLRDTENFETIYLKNLVPNWWKNE